jgi:hypothetical protein
MTQIFSEALTTGFVDLLAGRVVVDSSSFSIQRYFFVDVFDAMFTRLYKCPLFVVAFVLPGRRFGKPAMGIVSVNDIRLHAKKPIHQAPYHRTSSLLISTLFRVQLVRNEVFHTHLFASTFIKSPYTFNENPPSK